MDPHATEARAIPYRPPSLVDVRKARPRLPARYEPGVVLGAQETREELDRLRRQRDGPQARLGIGQPEDLAPPAPGKRQEPDGRHSGRGRPGPPSH